MPSLDFNAYATQLARKNGRQTMGPVIEKELLHYEILRSMEEKGLLNTLVFQGGTCLRLCYGASRYSEDLDFAGGSAFNAESLRELKSCMEEALPERYSIDVEVKEPSSEQSLVKKWRIRIDAMPARPDIASQKISLEVAAIPAYTRQPRMLQLNYEGLPSSYEDVILYAESLEEILADKLESFVCSRHVRYRDIWDLFWLSRRPNIDIAQARTLRTCKETDYGEAERFGKGITRVSENLATIIEDVEFAQQMKLFLPVEQYERTIARPEFRVVLAETITNLYL